MKRICQRYFENVSIAVLLHRCSVSSTLIHLQAQSDQVKSLVENEGLTARGVIRLFGTNEEKRCRLSLRYVNYIKEKEPCLPRSLDFRMRSARAAAKAEDLIMYWAFLNKKGT